MIRAIRRLHAASIGGFVIVALSLGYWQYFQADDLLGRATNPRPAEADRQIVRGRILDRTGVVLAESRPSANGMVRVYPLPAAAHVTGYHSSRYGDTNLEAKYASYLRGDRSADPVDRLIGSALHRPTVGSDIVVTIDARIQQAAMDALDGSAGAVVALDPRSGAVLALASAPTFDPSKLDDDWPRLSNDDAQPLYNRAILSTYTPGSTFKLITAAAALDLGLVDPNSQFRCTSQMDLGGLKVDCRNHAHLAALNFKEAFAWSSNRTFALTGLELGSPRLELGDGLRRPLDWERDGISRSAERLEEYARRFGLGRTVPFDLPLSASSLKSDGDWYASLLAQTAFGQGEIEATPIAMALTAATVANGGVVPAPYLVEEARAPTGLVSRIGEPGRTLGRAVKPETANLLGEMMVLSVETAYAQKARISGVKVAGKTGTAETGPVGSAPHSWFVGYAPAENPRVAVAVIIEHKGSGTDFAAPAAQRVLRAALETYHQAGR